MTVDRRAQMRVLFYKAIRETLEKQKWIGFWTLTFPPEKAIGSNDGALLSGYRKNFFAKLLKISPTVGVFWVYEGPPTTQKWHIHFLSDKFLALDTVKTIWFDTVGSQLMKHLQAGASLEKIKIKDTDEGLEQDYWIDYILKDIAIQDVEIGRTFKGVIQKPYGFLGNKHFTEQYKKLKDELTEKFYNLEIEFERKQNDFRFDSISAQPSYAFMRTVVDGKKKEFAGRFLKELEGFINQSSKYDFVKKHPEEWNKFKNKLSTMKESLSNEFCYVLVNLFLQLYRREKELASLKIRCGSFYKQLFSLLVSRLYYEDKQNLLEFLKCYRHHEELAVGFCSKVVNIFNELFDNIFCIREVYDIEADKVEELSYKSAARYSFELLDKREEFRVAVTKYIQTLTVTNRYPMIYEPKEWKFDPKVSLQDNFTGSYLLNGQEIAVPACRIWQTHKLYVKPLEGEEFSYLDVCLNHVQSRPFRVNREMLDFVLSPRCKLFKTEEYREEQEKLKEDLQKITLLQRDKDHFLNKINENLGKVREQRLVRKTFDEIFNLSNDVEFVYFPYSVDFRTRMVAISEVNPMSSKLCRALLLHPTPMKFDEDVFKYNAVKLRIKDKVSFERAIEIFNEEHYDYNMLNFMDVQSIFLEAAEPYGMLAACFEWKRYKEFIKKTSDLSENEYRTYFMMRVDATASGHQILSMIMNDGTYQKELNLAVADKGFREDTPQHYYTSVALEYLKEQLEAGNNIARILVEPENYAKLYLMQNRYFEFERLKKNNPEKICLENVLVPIFKALLMKGAYNATRGTFVNDVKDVLSKFDFRNIDQVKAGVPANHVFLDYEKFTGELINSIWKKKETNTMTYYINILKRVTEVFCKHGLEIKWLTRTGGYVFQMYSVKKLIPVWKSVPALLNANIKVRQEQFPDRTKVLSESGKRKKSKELASKYNRIYISKFADKLDKRKTMNATAPSFIHSLDADIIYEFTKAMIKMPYISYFLVHDTIEFPIYYYFEIMSKLACANHAIFAETKNKCGKTMLQLFIENLLSILKEHSPAAAEDAEILAREVQQEFSRSRDAINKEFDYNALINSRIYY
jgi:hypothetical protein